MKKVYQVPEVECVSLVPEEEMTTTMPINDGIIGGVTGYESSIF